MSLITIAKPKNDKNYIIFETLYQTTEESTLFIFIALFSPNSTKEITIVKYILYNQGSSNSCDIKLMGSDLAISSIHAGIIFRNNKFFIYDKSSKYGSLIMEKSRVKLEHKAKYQIENILIKSYIKISSTMYIFFNLSLNVRFDKDISQEKLIISNYNSNDNTFVAQVKDNLIK